MRRPIMVALCALLASATFGVPAQAQPPAEPSGQETAARKDPKPNPDRVENPDAKLRANWRTSQDRAVTTSSDDAGLRILVADEKDAYRWRTVANLSEPGLLTDQWIGQFCITGSAKRAVVVYAPRQFTNRDVLMDSGGFGAVVDLESGAVTKLGGGFSLAYYNPGCGVAETAALSRLETSGETWIGLVDAETSRLVQQVRTSGQVTSPVPHRGEIAAVRGAALVGFDPAGRERELAKVDGVPFRLHPDASEGLAFQTTDGNTTRFERLARNKVSTVASAPNGTVKLRPGSGGRIFLAGHHATSKMPRGINGGWQALDTAPDSDISTTGGLAVTRARRHDSGVDIAARTGNGVAVDFSVGLGMPTMPSSEVSAGTMSGEPGDGSTTPVDLDRGCSVPRNDATLQTYQPSGLQVEWAADLAVKNMLTFQRPDNWNNNHLAAYSPQGLFPSIPLDGGGTVPAQVFLGILAQESNLWQASYHAVDGLAGNPLTSLGYYGLDLDHPNFNKIDFSNVDCGYGVGQVTTGMKASETDTVVNGITMSYLHQKTVALDYATNVAAALRILQDKWNTTRRAGLIANNGSSSRIENWWFAIWAYNTGFYENQGDGSPWGVGWSNNPSNPKYPADRQMFLTAPLDVPAEGVNDEIGYDNAKHPNHWSYPERVIGFAYTSLIKLNYATGSWSSTYLTAQTNGSRLADQPGRFTFCVPAVNQCDPAVVHQPAEHPNEKPGPCTRDDLKCWWSQPVTWTDCAANCGTEKLRYTTVEPRPLVTAKYNSQCALTGLPSGVKIIDNVDLGTSKWGAGGCTPTWTKGGSFGFTFGSSTWNGQTIYPSKVDLHQIGGGFGGHFWFTHTLRHDAQTSTQAVTGKWTINPTNSWTRVYVHVPDHGAHTKQARYVITLPDGRTKERVIPTRYEKHTWIDLGVFDFTGAGTPSVQLSNFTYDGGHNSDVAWDAIAVQPLAAKPEHFVVAMGDSYSSGEGAGSYTSVSNQYGGDGDAEGSSRNACRRSPKTWSRQATITGAPGTIGALADAQNTNLDYHLIACSGARSHNMLPAGVSNAFGESSKGQHGELAQIEQGFLDENTTLVTLSVGGNDARFVKTFMACAEESPGDGCAAPGFTMEGDPAPLADYAPTLLTDKVKPSVALVLEAIKTRAPNAKIMLMGYPRLFSGSETFPGEPDGINSAEAAFLDGLADNLLILALAPLGDSRVQVMDPRATFEGHGVDAINVGDEQWVNGVIVHLPPFLGGEEHKVGASMECFHPKVRGYEEMGGVLSDYLYVAYQTW